MAAQDNDALKILNEVVDRYRVYSYDQFVKMINDNWSENVEVKSPAGEEYQVYTYAFYDDKKKGTIRVLGSVSGDDGAEEASWWKFWKLIERPIASTSFIIAPDGTFIDE